MGFFLNKRESGRRRRMHFRVVLVLLLALLRGIAAGGGNVVAAIGSSVLLDPEYGANLSDSQVEWTFKNSSGKLLTILDYVPNSPVQKPNKHYHSRLRFNASNGSIMVGNLKPSDQGVYTITVNGTWNRSMDLKLIEPLSEPTIVNNCTCVDTAVQLICQVSGGSEISILWWKGNKMLTSSQYYQLVQTNSTLIISEAQISDCGTYTCTVENPVSQKNASYSLRLRGLTHLHHCVLALSVAALVTAGAILITAVATRLDDILCVSNYGCLFIREMMRRLLKFAPELSFLSFSVACLCWILTEVCLDMPDTLPTLSQLIANTIQIVHIIGYAGNAGISFVLSMSWLLHLTVVLSNYRFIRDKPILDKIISNKFCRVILNVAAPVIAVFGPSILIGEVMKQTDSDCDSATSLRSTIMLTVGITLLILVANFVAYEIYINWKKQPTGTPPANTSLGDSDQHQYTEQKKTPPCPGHTATTELVTQGLLLPEKNCKPCD
ncbi:uncharacterized protein LOC125446596 isoform X2 [Stegostoma tigrinum]|uniref:uncharacterized protein LOC125446596 isoform X2 n=2 Tax=Stegostoma tigrinum TaxID=3053191 RepID=UPI00287054C3|nr:uncharacterized protein LOC125446596 isoform X2 [Stegostoma tigrinum]